MKSLFISTCLILLLGCGASDKIEPSPLVNLPNLGKELSQDPVVSVTRVDKRNETGITVEQSGKVVAESSSLIDVLRYVCPERHYLMAETELPAGVYNITITPSSSQNAYYLLKKEVQRIFALSVSLQNLEVTVISLVVASTNRLPDGMQTSKDQRGLPCHDGKHFKNYDMQRFCQIIDSFLGEPVLNKTTLSGQFDFSFNLVGVQFQPSHLTDELSKCGLSLKKNIATIRYMIIKKKDT